MKSIVMTWQAASTFGWGILGLNVFCHWAVDPDVTPLMVTPIAAQDLRWLDPLRQMAIREAVGVSNTFAEQVAKTGPADTLQLDCPVIHGLGNGLAPTRFRGTKNVGRLIFEDTRFDHFEEKTERYDALLVASTWARDLVRAHTTRPVHLIHEGVDPSVFFPGPRSALLDPRRFYVFSGGKIEFRKAQDLVVAAFRVFAARHRDAVLVTSWHSPWPRISAGFAGTLQVPVELDDTGRVNATKWAVDNGIPPAQFVDVGPIPNQLMPQVLREMDVSLQPSRAEACTNLPAKEAMACGVPVILAANSGALDLIDVERNPEDAVLPHCLPLREQGPVPPGHTTWGTDGWGESHVDEILNALEYVYANRQDARAMGRRGAAWLVSSHRTWSDHAAALKALVRGL
jgi:glycosyltransferase involved in cell wall biosynthesis